MIEQSLVAHSSPRRMSLLLLSSVALIVIGLWMTGVFGEVPTTRRRSAEFVQTIGWVTIIFFGGCAAAAILGIFDRRERLRVSAQGIYWKSWSEQIIPWSDIKDISVWRHRGQKMIILTLSQTSHRWSGETKSWLASGSRAITGGDIAISTAGLDARFDEVMATIERFRGNAQGQ